MNLSHGIEHFGKVLSGVIDRRISLPAEPFSRTAQTPSPTAGALGGFGRAVKGAAGSPILDAGQALIAGMRLTTGAGDPERGEPFGQGSARFSGAGETVGSAYPVADWQGSGAQAYATANLGQAGRTEAMAALDRGVQTVIAREAYQVAHHRDRLDDQSNYLADLSYLTWSIALIPGTGKALKAAFELAAVNAALSICSVEIYQLSQEAGENAEQLRELAGEYSAFTRQATPPDLDGAPPNPLPDEPPGPGPTEQDRPGHPVLVAVPGAPRASQPAPAGSVPSSPRAGAAAPAADPNIEAAGSSSAPGPAPMATSTAVPPDMTSGMAAAFGAVGGLIGSVFTPLAAVLTGAAGAAAAAGQSLSTLTSADVATAPDQKGNPAIGDGPLDTDSDDDRDQPNNSAPNDSAPNDSAEVGDDIGPAVPGVVAEPERPELQPTHTFEQPPDEKPPEPAPTPPAATRPPQ